MTPQRGRPTYYDEPKKRHNIIVTDQAWEGLKKIAQDNKISVSEYLETLGRCYFKSEGG